MPSADAPESYVADPNAPVDLETQHANQAEAMTHVVEGEDALNIPAAPMEYLGHNPTASPHAHMPKLATKSLEARRTAIPVLLVSGVMFSVAGALKYFVSEDAPIADFPSWMSMSLFAVSGVLIIVAVLNMLHVRQQMSAASTAVANANAEGDGSDEAAAAE